MPRYRSRSRSRSPVRRSKHYDDPRDRRRDRRSPPPSGLLVRNISLKARPEDLRGHFERFGPVKDVYLPKDYYSGEPRGFGFVKFRYPEDAAEAKSQLNNTVIGGREIRIAYAEENRKTPQEMNRVSHVSSRRSSRRRSPSESPRRGYLSDSRSPSPARARRDSRRHVGRDNDRSTHQSRSLSMSDSGGDDKNVRARDRSPRQPRSVSRSLSPREKNHRPSRGSQGPRKRSPSPCERNHRPNRGSQSPRESSLSPHERNHRSRRRSPSPREIGKNGYVPSRSPSPIMGSRSPGSPR